MLMVIQASFTSRGSDGSLSKFSGDYIYISPKFKTWLLESKLCDSAVLENIFNGFSAWISKHATGGNVEGKRMI